MRHEETVYKKTGRHGVHEETDKEVAKSQRVLKEAREGRVSRKKDWLMDFGMTVKNKA